MTELNRLDRMNQIITDKYETPLASKIIWRQARAMEAIDTYNLSIERNDDKVKVKLLTSAYNHLSSILDGEQIDKFYRAFERVDNLHSSAFDAVEYFLQVLEEVKTKK